MIGTEFLCTIHIDLILRRVKCGMSIVVRDVSQHSWRPEEKGVSLPTGADI